jgi:hypothetical protein
MTRMDDSDNDSDGPQVLLERMFEAKKRVHKEYIRFRSVASQ